MCLDDQVIITDKRVYERSTLMKVPLKDDVLLVLLIDPLRDAILDQAMRIFQEVAKSQEEDIINVYGDHLLLYQVLCLMSLMMTNIINHNQRHRTALQNSAKGFIILGKDHIRFNRFRGGKIVTFLSYDGAYGQTDKVLSFIQQFNFLFVGKHFTKPWWANMRTQGTEPKNWRCQDCGPGELDRNGHKSGHGLC